MSYVIGASSDRAFYGGVQHIEDERRVDGNGRMKTVRRLPCAVTDATDEITMRAGGLQRQPSPVAGYRISFAQKSSHPNLQTLYRGVNIARSTAGAGLLPQYVPRLDRLA